MFSLRNKELAAFMATLTISGCAFAPVSRSWISRPVAAAEQLPTVEAEGSPSPEPTRDVQLYSEIINRWSEETPTMMTEISPRKRADNKSGASVVCGIVDGGSRFVQFSNISIGTNESMVRTLIQAADETEIPVVFGRPSPENGDEAVDCENYQAESADIFGVYIPEEPGLQSVLLRQFNKLYLGE